ncbi:hypothetical protein OESDEN_14887 [Oesophagostomum dentatum]|uniref:Uncharacterized protein n=1 Tax=Oesophagostomum dentatum TaxID=61180 RepID=A0A0B1SKC6_OESDE|nr:hypothetical protein OESDEN_14887 [Oesophagostomum dentatum]
MWRNAPNEKRMNVTCPTQTVPFIHDVFYGGYHKLNNDSLSCAASDGSWMTEVNLVEKISCFSEV